MFGRNHENSGLEHRLRAERPQPSDELVRRLAAQVEPQGRPVLRRGALRVGLIAAVTAALALSLGATGAIGSATGSIHLFGRTVFHLVQPPARTPASSPSTASPSSSPTTSPSVTVDSSQAARGLDPAIFTFHHFPPFMHQYAGKIPICWHHQIIYVTPFQWFWYFIHGAGPARSCFFPRG